MLSRSTTKKTLATATAALAALAFCGSGSAPAATSHHGNPSVYLDLRPLDGGTAPDILVAAVSNTTTGVVRFSVRYSNRETFGPDDILSIFLDVDRNAATGDEGGMDYVVQVHGTEPVVAKLLRSGQFQVVDAPSLRTDWQEGTQEVELSMADVGGSTAFRFFLFTFVNGVTTVFDESPDGSGLWDYTLRTPHIKDLRTDLQPQTPRAGRRLQVSNVTAALESGETVAADRVTCRATLGGKALHGAGAGGCSLALPRAAKGKALRLTVAARVGDQTKTVTYALRVR